MDYFVKPEKPDTYTVRTMDLLVLRSRLSRMPTLAIQNKMSLLILNIQKASRKLYVT